MKMNNVKRKKTPITPLPCLDDGCIRSPHITYFVCGK